MVSYFSESRAKETMAKLTRSFSIKIYQSQVYYLFTAEILILTYYLTEFLLISLIIQEDVPVSEATYKVCFLEKSNRPLPHPFVLAWVGLSDKHMQTFKFCSSPHKHGQTICNAHSNSRIMGMVTSIVSLTKVTGSIHKVNEAYSCLQCLSLPVAPQQRIRMSISHHVLW